jgi:hypothetical protein
MLCFRSRYSELVNSPPSLMILNSFTIYYSAILRPQRDERLICPCSEDILYFLFQGADTLSQFFTVSYDLRLFYNLL